MATTTETRDDTTASTGTDIIHYIDPVPVDEVRYSTRHKASRKAFAEAITDDAFAGLDGHLDRG